LLEFLLEREMLHAKVVQKIKTHFVFSNVIPKIVPFIS